MAQKNERIEKIILIYVLRFIFIGLFLQTPAELVMGMKNIIGSTGILISDYMVIGGIGPTLVNGGLVAALFVTTIAPLAGSYGFLTGVLAGFVHLSLVHFTGSLHGGLNLYNNGFTGGLVATVIVGVMKGYKKEN